MMKKSESAKIESVCTYCGVGCDIAAEVSNGHIERIFAEKDGVVSQGKLCIKGRYGFDFVESRERVREPRIRKKFIEKNRQLLGEELLDRLRDFDSEYYSCELDTALDIAALKLEECSEKFGEESFCAIGGARSSCESAYAFQKFCRETMNSPHIDSCARVCHSPSLRGMKETIGEGAATNPYNDIYEAEFLLVIGSNTMDAHPIIANRIVDCARQHDNLAVIDVRETKLAKMARHNCTIPYESNLLILNMMAYVILDEELYDKEFVATRTCGFEEYRESILNDPYANPSFFRKVKGYEYLAKSIPNIAREYALKRSMILWGLGVTEHIDGSYAVMAITHLALLTGNIGKNGAGLMPLRGQNNVQGACDMGCLPYYAPDYEKPAKKGLSTPKLIDAMLEGKIVSMINMGEDLLHIHPNLNKISKALSRMEFIMVQELFMSEIAKRADIVIGVKSAYEKTGVYINAMRRLHLSQPLLECDLPDDWEVLSRLSERFGKDFGYRNSEDVWNEVRRKAPKRFSHAEYYRLERHRKRGMQWPVFHEDTPRLHLLDFRTEDGLGRFRYTRWKMRGMVEELVEGSFKPSENSYRYLTTGRILTQYNNSAQTAKSPRLEKRYAEDIVMANPADEEKFGDKVLLRSRYGESEALSVKYSDTIREGTIFSTFHYAQSGINRLFGDERDELVDTACFKSLKVEVIALGEEFGCS